MAAQPLEVPIESLVVSVANTRKDKDAGQEDASIDGLAQSIKEQGLLNPLTVRKNSDGKFEILAGQRRYLACLRLGFKTVPVMLRESVSDTSAVALSLIENVQRADMHPIDKATAFDELRRHHNGNLRSVSEATGVSVQTVQRYLLLLKLPEHLRDQLGTGKGSAGVGALANIAKAFDDPEEMQEAWDKIGGFNQDIQSEILKRAGGDLDALPNLVFQAQEGAFDAKACGSSLHDCPHIPDELRVHVINAARALEEGVPEPERSLKEIAAQHRRKKRK